MTTKQKRKLIKKLKERAKRIGAGSLAIYFFIISVFIPAPPVMALTGGPSQPEFQSFEPIGTSDMVNLFSGDFTYNIPLLDVEGYPINLAYNSGISTDQEASWVGLGWNVNVGSINRSLRGLPDDFKGDKVRTETNIEDNWTIGMDASINFELFGKDLTELEKLLGQQSNPLNLSVNLGVNYNNYNGVGTSLGFGISQSFEMFKLPMNAGLGLNSTSSGGLNISPSFGLTLKGSRTSISSNVGCSFNSRQGLSNLSIGASLNKSLLIFPASANASFNMMQPTYTPTINNSMRSYAVSGRAKGAFSLWGSDVGIAVGASYSSQGLKESEKDKEVPSYGYMYSEVGQDNNHVRHDFNREKEGSVTPATKNLALTNYTYDIYSVTGQGVGGSYRPYRGQVGHVYSNYADNTSSSVPFTVELGAGGLFHGGTEVGVTTVNTKTGPWRTKSKKFKGENYADDALSFKRNSGKTDFENIAFREANEMSVIDVDYYNQFGGDKAVEVQLKKNANYNVSAQNVLVDKDNNTYPITKNYQEKRSKRNAAIQNLTIKQVRDGFGLADFEAASYANTSAENHHIGQIISLGQDGNRYVYGQPAYNTTQQEVTFAVGTTINGDAFNMPKNYNKGLISYTSGPMDQSGYREGDNTLENDWGLDNYFQRVTTPAYAHSYLLTAVVSNDYVDVDPDTQKGPSANDLGTYTKFNYNKIIDDYKWRVPFQQNKASYNEGLKSDLNDDKASYLYGEKEMFYLESIETKNYIAVFETFIRDDARGVKDDNGGMNTSTNGSVSMGLKKISLYTIKDYANGTNPNAVPIKEVHFVYEENPNNELCQGIPNNINNGGKLTLKKVYFTYRDSKKGKLSPYVFNYGYNPDYNLKAYDRWGNYKPNTANSGNYNEQTLATFEYPYVDQEQVDADLYASAWSLQQIDLPSGGMINVDLEADDYQYVQDKKAMQMAKITQVGSDNTLYESFSVSDNSSNGDKNKKLYFEKDPNIAIEDYVEGIEDIYFRCLVEFNPLLTNSNAPPPTPSYDYVSGYAKIKSYADLGTKGMIELKPVSFRDNDNTEDKNPIALAGIQYGRLYLPKLVWGAPQVQGDQDFDDQLLTSLWQTLSNFKTGFKNPNKALFDNDYTCGSKIVLGKSWLRLNNVTQKKLGGGCRVKEIRMNDSWSDMTASTMNSSDYGQTYDYTLQDGNSSGVASYEPQLGGDENPFKQPVPFQDTKRWAPDDRFYQETPFGESFFPSASVGYSQVTVKNIERNNVKRNATGKVVHEFYTAKDFPTKVSKTELNPIRHKSDPFSLANIFKTSTKDYYTGTQGYVIENNDMHGKPKGQMVYQEDQGNPISEIRYNYKQELKNGEQIDRLANNTTVIYANGEVKEAVIGVNFDMVADFSESTTKIFSSSMNLNIDGIPVGFLPFPIPMLWPSVNNEKTLFRSAVMTKVVNRFGILESTVATDLGSTVETRNEAYDAETGQVLLTKTITNYDDEIYQLNIPAYWHYKEMGPAYQNIGVTMNNKNIFDGKFTTNEPHLFNEGDELIINSGKAWVTAINGNEIELQQIDGSPPPAQSNTTIEVIRSGKRNMQSQMMASMTTLGNSTGLYTLNPLDKFKDNVFENVIQASAIEYTNKWKTFCDCNLDAPGNSSTNPYVIGTKGNFRPNRSFSYLTGRTQSDYNNNTNIRKDGVMESFAPYYQLQNNGSWQIAPESWTYSAEVTVFNPYGQELENKDPLDRYSAAQFGFNQTLPKAVAANSKYKEMGFTSFEDEGFSDCADNHFKFNTPGLGVTDDQAHSGRHSIRVNPSNSAVLGSELYSCENTDAVMCDLDIDNRTSNFDPTTGGFNSTIWITGGSNPIISWNIISGNPNIIYPLGPPNNPYLNRLRIDINGSEECVIQITATDDNGCTFNRTYYCYNGNVIPIIL